jgi:hypothetical protein
MLFEGGVVKADASAVAAFLFKNEAGWDTGKVCAGTTEFVRTVCGASSSSSSSFQSSSSSPASSSSSSSSSSSLSYLCGRCFVLMCADPTHSAEPSRSGCLSRPLLGGTCLCTLPAAAAWTACPSTRPSALFFHIVRLATPPFLRCAHLFPTQHHTLHAPQAPQASILPPCLPTLPGASDRRTLPRSSMLSSLPSPRPTTLQTLRRMLMACRAPAKQSHTWSLVCSSPSPSTLLPVPLPDIRARSLGLVS